MSPLYPSAPIRVKLYVNTMAAPRIPSLEEILERGPEAYAHLPAPMLEEIRNRLLEVARNVEGSTNVPETPIDMALQHPKYKWMDAQHIHHLGDEIATTVEASKVYGESGGLVVTEPPRHAKSHTCSVWTPFWFLARYPLDNVMLIGAEQSFARKWGGKVRRLIEVHGEQYNLRLNPKRVAQDDWELTTGGGMACVGAGGMISGKPAKLLVCDDLVKNDEEARSEVMREKLYDWWEGTVLQRIEPDTTVIVIGTRYHEDDIIGRILQHSEAGDGHPFRLVSLPAKAEDNDPLGRALGVGLWLSHFPQSYYDAREIAVSPYVWNSVYQQRPTAPGGNMVDPAWWRFYRPTELPASFDQEAQSWDISLDAEKKTDSMHAGLIASRHGALIYLRDGFAEHCDINKVISTIRTWNLLFPKARAKLVERATAGVALAQTLRSEVAGILPWPPKGKQKGSKEACLDAIIPAIRSGNVLLPLNPDGSQPRWVKMLIEQTRQFPRGQYDDLVDSLSQLVGYLLPGARSAISKDHREASMHTDPLSPSEHHLRRLHATLQKLGNRKLELMREWQQRNERSVLPFTRGFDTSIRAGMRVSSRGRRGMW